MFPEQYCSNFGWFRPLVTPHKQNSWLSLIFTGYWFLFATPFKSFILLCILYSIRFFLSFLRLFIGSFVPSFVLSTWNKNSFYDFVKRIVGDFPTDGFSIFFRVHYLMLVSVSICPLSECSSVLSTIELRYHTLKLIDIFVGLSLSWNA